MQQNVQFNQKILIRRVIFAALQGDISAQVVHGIWVTEALTNVVIPGSLIKQYFCFCSHYLQGYKYSQILTRIQ